MYLCRWGGVRSHISNVTFRKRAIVTAFLSSTLINRNNVYDRPRYGEITSFKLCLSIELINCDITPPYVVVASQTRLRCRAARPLMSYQFPTKCPT